MLIKEIGVWGGGGGGGDKEGGTSIFSREIGLCWFEEGGGGYQHVDQGDWCVYVCVSAWVC